MAGVDRDRNRQIPPPGRGTKSLQGGQAFPM